MSSVDGSTLDSISSACAQPRAVVYLTVEWSVYERMARKHWAEARPLIDSIGTVRTFVISEEDPEVLQLLRSQQHESGARGVGRVLWLESGKVIAQQQSVSSSGELVQRTLDLWIYNLHPDKVNDIA